MSDIIHLIILIFHVLGATVIIGSSFVSFIVVVKPKIPWENLQLLGLLWKLLGPAIGVQTLTGLYLAASEWDKFGHNPLFWTKIVLYLTDGIVAELIIKRKLKQALVKEQKEIVIGGIKPAVLASFVTLTTIAILGVWLAESQP